MKKWHQLPAQGPAQTWKVLLPGPLRVREAAHPFPLADSLLKQYSEAE